MHFFDSSLYFYESYSINVLIFLHCLPVDQTCFPDRDITHNYDLGYGESVDTMTALKKFSIFCISSQKP